MADERSVISEAFQAFLKEAPQHAQAWGAMVQGLSAASALDPKTSALAYLAALGLESGIPYHAIAARKAGASREEVIGSILAGLPAAGHRVTLALPAALAAYDSQPNSAGR